MNYQEISQFIQANHIYGGVTEAEKNALEVNHFMIFHGGECYIGADVPVIALQDKEIINSAE